MNKTLVYVCPYCYITMETHKLLFPVSATFKYSYIKEFHGYISSCTPLVRKDAAKMWKSWMSYLALLDLSVCLEKWFIYSVSSIHFISMSDCQKEHIDLYTCSLSFSTNALLGSGYHKFKKYIFLVRDTTCTPSPTLTRNFTVTFIYYAVKNMKITQEISGTR